jgi:hypothetical protein
MNDSSPQPDALNKLTEHPVLKFKTARKLINDKRLQRRALLMLSAFSLCLLFKGL